MYTNTLVFMVRSPYFRRGVNLLKCSRANSSTVKPVLSAKKVNDDINENGDLSKSPKSNKSEGIKPSLIAKAFAPLKEQTLKKTNSLDESINNAETPEQLLNLVDTCKLNRKQALMIVSILAEWTVTGEADMKVFERDPRFTSLCQTLGKPYRPPIEKVFEPQADDLTMVLNVKNDEQAAKIINSFNLQQLIKVLSSLAYKKRRSVPLLRSLSYNIAHNTSKVNIKLGADILYALAILNYPDEVLLEKISSVLQEYIPSCKKTSVIGSISTSLGILHYKNEDLLDCLSHWVSNNVGICRNQDLNSVLFTLAHVNHQPANAEKFFQEVHKRMLEYDLGSTRLEVIWALTILNQAIHEDFTSVLNPKYYDKLKSTYSREIPRSTAKKLLNVNGAARLSKGYNGPLFEVNEELDIAMLRSKEKQILVTSVFEAMSNLLPSSVYLRTNINLNMGFSLDGECLVDSKMTPLPLFDKKSGQPLPVNEKGIKIGIFVWDYRDHTKGKVALNGVASLCERLATASGYRILSVPYLDFNPKDKLTERVKYLEKKIKMLVNRS